MSTKLVARLAVFVSLFALFFTAAMPARASEAGLLTCRSPQTTSYFMWSSQSYDCWFQSAVGGGSQHYSAVINRAGAEAGWSSNVTLLWAVFALSSKVGPGTLEGGYVGASAGAAVGIGARGNALVGGLPNSITLQPLSVEGEAGLNVRATVTSLWLQSASERRRHARLRRHRM
jgi:hypothetical protein